MRTILLIGVGAGDPEHVTMQAVNAMRGVDVFFLLDKGEVKQDLIDVRQDILRRYAGDRPYRVVAGRDPARDRTTPAYVEAVDDWRRRRADVCERMITESLGEGETGAFLVWGDPTLYDSTIAIIEDILARGTVVFDYSVIPGISSLSALVARHRVPMNQVGRPVQITTGRRLAEGWPSEVDDLLVMLDAGTAFTELGEVDPEQVEIYWGAYLGTRDELLVHGRLAEVADRIVAIRAEAKARKGWIMDSYLLRRRQ